MTLEFTSADHTPGHADVVGTERLIDRAALAALLETEPFIAPLA